MKKRVLILSESSVYLDDKRDFIARGGGAMCMHNIAKASHELGFFVDYYSLKEFENQRAKELIDGVNYIRTVSSSRSSFKLFSYLWKSWKMAKKYDYVIVNQFLPHLLLMFLPGKKKLAVVHDVYMDKKNFWFRQFGFFTGLVGYFIEFLQLINDRFFSSKIMTVSLSSEEKMARVIGKSVMANIFINQNSLDLSKYRSDLEKENFLLFVGRFVHYKHPEHLLYVLKGVVDKYPDFRAVFVMTRDFEEIKEKFLSIVEKLDLGDKIELKNFLSDAELKELYARAKILVHPSYMEGQGIVLLEALASKTPVVAYDLPAYKGMLINGVNAEVIDKGDKDLLLEGVFRVLDNYEEYRLKSDLVLKNFDFNNFKESLLKNFYL